MALNLGSRPVDIEIYKSAGATIEQDQENNRLLWHVQNITEEGNAVLQFGSQHLVFDEMFPVEIRFEETYSLIDVNVQQVVNAQSGDPMSLKTIHSLSTESYSITA